MRTNEFIKRRLRQLVREELSRIDLKALVREQLATMDLPCLVSECRAEVYGPAEQGRQTFLH